MKALIAIGLAALPVMPAGAMTVAEFLGKVDGLYAKGPMALFSPDLKLVKAEGMASTAAWRAQAHAPNACPPDRDMAIGQRTYLAMLRAVPPAHRGQTVTQAVTAHMNKLYPCA